MSFGMPLAINMPLTVPLPVALTLSLAMAINYGLALGSAFCICFQYVIENAISHPVGFIISFAIG